jgi:hypothetical protein
MTVISSPRRSLRIGFEPMSGTRGENQGFSHLERNVRLTFVYYFISYANIGLRVGPRKATTTKHW